MMEFVRRNVKYPDEALAKNIGGSVIIQFVIETDGSIGRQKVLKNVHPLLDAEAFRYQDWVFCIRTQLKVTTKMLAYFFDMITPTIVYPK